MDQIAKTGRRCPRNYHVNKRDKTKCNRVRRSPSSRRSPSRRSPSRRSPSYKPICEICENVSDGIIVHGDGTIQPMCRNCYNDAKDKSKYSFRYITARKP